MTTKIKHKNKRVKIGTVIDSDLLRKVKERAVREGRTISDIIHDALVQYDENDQQSLELRMAAFKRFCSRPSTLSLSEINEILDEDIYDV
ncbi:MAG: hypothetical protein M0P71_15750 [Melioribacteraceae bacterium]|nr:hypothetical protein [Melioribacteraceae bacterium]